MDGARKVKLFADERRAVEAEDEFTYAEREESWG